jgi:hypothetical protein
LRLDHRFQLREVDDTTTTIGVAETIETTVMETGFTVTEGEYLASAEYLNDYNPTHGGKKDSVIG